MPDIQFVLGLIIGAVSALAAGSVLLSSANTRVKKYVLIALAVAAAYLLLNYVGCGGMTGKSHDVNVQGFSKAGRHFTDGCVLGAALAFIVYRMWPRK